MEGGRVRLWMEGISFLCEAAHCISLLPTARGLLTSKKPPGKYVAAAPAAAAKESPRGRRRSLQYSLGGLSYVCPSQQLSHSVSSAAAAASSPTRRPPSAGALHDSDLGGGHVPIPIPPRG